MCLFAFSTIKVLHLSPKSQSSRLASEVASDTGATLDTQVRIACAGGSTCITNMLSVIHSLQVLVRDIGMLQRRMQAHRDKYAVTMLYPDDDL